MSAQTDNHPMFAFYLAALPGLNAIAVLLLALLSVLIVIFAIQLIVRLALIVFLIICLPALFLMLANRHTMRFGQAGISSYITAVVTQFLQLTVMTAGTKILLPFLTARLDHASGLASMAILLEGIALFWLILRIPGLLRQWSLSPIAESGQAVRAFAYASLARIFFL
jgi:hypothetical protein